MDRFLRVRALFKDKFEKIRDSRVIILGAGGVGSMALDCLYRSGVGEIVVVDKDIYDVTNQNRQIGSEAVGQYKVNYLSSIYKGVIPIVARVDKEWIEGFDFDSFDVVLDCLDFIPAKVALAHKSYKKLISSGGSAKRIDPRKICVGSIWDKTPDRFVKKFQYVLKKSAFDGDFSLVYSTEPPNCKELGSFMGVTGSFGLFMASMAIRKIIDEN